LVDWCIVIIVVMSMAPGCGGRTKTVRRETVREPATETTIERRTEVTETDDDDGGIVSGTVGAVGDVIALPFRLVGGVIDAIF
jgi:hypothetical protein